MQAVIQKKGFLFVQWADREREGGQNPFGHQRKEFDLDRTTEVNCMLDSTGPSARGWWWVRMRIETQLGRCEPIGSLPVWPRNKYFSTNTTF